MIEEFYDDYEDFEEDDYPEVVERPAKDGNVRERNFIPNCEINTPFDEDAYPNAIDHNFFVTQDFSFSPFKYYPCYNCRRSYLGGDLIEDPIEVIDDFDLLIYVTEERATESSRKIIPPNEDDSEANLYYVYRCPECYSFIY